MTGMWHPWAHRRSRSGQATLSIGGWKLVAIAASLLVAGLPLPGLAQETPQPPIAPPDPASTARVTLVTGDVVTLSTLADGRQVAEVERPEGASGGVSLQEIQGDVFVIPDEAVPLLGADTLDHRLFNVTDLVEMGYDDASQDVLPVIATYDAPASLSAASASSAPNGSALERSLPAIDSAALEVDKETARTFWETIAPESTDLGDPAPELEGGLAKLWLDGRVQADLSESVPQVGAPEAWAAGYDGDGISVAVLDTGVDLSHPDLVDQVESSLSFVPDQDVTDVNGHGTHVASTIAGTGAASDGLYVGVAPGADLLVGKVLGDDGFGQDSWVIAGMEWAAESGADVVNMSLGDTVPSDGSDPMSMAVDTLSATYGTLFVIAAGNQGPETISSPGASASALTVGAVDKQDDLAWFSSTGPLTGTGAIKPDLVAPGVGIMAARSQYVPDGGSESYHSLDGTSMATPHVAGAAAILAQRYPDWSGAELKDALMSSAAGLADWYSPYDVGTGRLDVTAAVTTPVRATGSLFFGFHDWPHEPTDEPVTRELVLTNLTDADLSLDLQVIGASDVFMLGAATVSVPAGGAATVPVTGDPLAADIGRHQGYLVGSDAATGAPLTRTSLAMIKEAELYDLTVDVVDRAGAPADAWVSINRAGDFWPSAYFVEGTATFRMAPGAYTVTTTLDVAGEGPDRSGLATLVEPEVILDQDTHVSLDASEARLLEAEAPRLAEDRQRKVDFSIRNVVDGFEVEFRNAYVVPVTYDDLYVSPTDPVQEGDFLLTTRWRKGEPMLRIETPGGRLSLIPYVQAGSTLTQGTVTAAGVYAGSGGADDYAGIDAEGKVVVVDRTDAVSPDERAAAAAEAGALALLVVNDGAGVLSEWVGESPIPVGSVHRDTGRQLVELVQAGGQMLRVVQTPFPSYLYDLTRDYPDQVPDAPLVYRPTHQDLARIHARYFGTTGVAGSGYRFDLTLSPSLGFEELEWHPGTREEWVTPGQEWVETHNQDVFGALPWTMSSSTNTYSVGGTTTLDWFRPATRPAFSETFGVQNSRWQDYMTWNVQQWSSFSDVMQLGGYLPWGATPNHLQVFQGDTLIYESEFGADMQWQEVPPGDLPYRVVLDAERPVDVFPLSIRTHTEWDFRSDTVDSEVFEPFAVLQLDYRLATDLSGNLRPGRSQQIAVRPSSSDGGALPGGPATDVTLDISFDDGATWQPVSLGIGSDGWWQGRFTVDPSAVEHVSVRASATTGDGYSISQEVIRAYGVAPPGD